MKLKVNFEYGDRVIAILLDESLIHINNLLEQIYQPRDGKEGDQWVEAYDYLEDECIKAFIKQSGIDENDVAIDGFKQTTNEDPTGLRVSVIDTSLY
jgi:hypothetical protein